MNTVRFHDRPYVPASHEHPDAPGVWKKVLVQRGDLIDGRVQMINWALLPAGAAFQPHYHEDMQEVFIILNGSVSITVGGETTILGAGDTVVIPVGSVHVMRNCGDVDVCYIALGITREGKGRTVVVGDTQAAG